MTKRKNSTQFGLKELLISLLLMFVIWGVQECFDIDLTQLLAEPAVLESEPTGDIQVAFTAPRYPDEEADHHGGLDEKLAAAIDAATDTVDVAAFDFDLARVAEAMVRADERGVRVRMVTDADYEDELGPRRLRQASIPVVTDERGPFMHNKFVIIDGQEVWTGSWNLTDNGTYRNNNNVVIVQSSKLAENYTQEFEEMFERGEFGVTSSDDTPYPDLDLNGIRVETTFESEGNVRERIIELILDAEESVGFLAFAFTDDDIAQAMIERHRDGLEVYGVIEARNAAGSGSDFEALQRAGIDLLEDGNPYVMHHKVIILDKEIVVTGSYNFSASAANSNDENVLIIHSPEIAASFTEELDRVIQQAESAVE